MTTVPGLLNAEIEPGTIYSPGSRCNGNSLCLAGETALVRKSPQHVNRLFPGLSLVDAFADIDSNTRHDAGQRSGPAAFDRAVDVAAQQPFDLRVATDHIG